MMGCTHGAEKGEQTPDEADNGYTQEVAKGRIS
jgi:hypothetical protein